MQTTAVWVIEKKVGIFSHYFISPGKFQPGIKKAKKFASRDMAQIMAKAHGGVVRQLSKF